MPDPEPFRFDRLEHLARLPWFEVEGTRLVLADRGVGPVIDMHAHYALPTLWPTKIDLDAPRTETGDTQLLLRCCDRHDLEVYANANFGEVGVRRLKRELVLGGATGRGARATHTIANHAADCADMGVTHSAILAVDVGIPTRHLADSVAAAQRSGIATAFASVHPRKRRPKEKLEEQLHAGARGLKLHPQLQLFAPTAPEARRLYTLAASERIPVLWHCGPVGIELEKARPFVQVAGYEAALEAHPDTTFVLGHAGAMQCDVAIGLQRRHANAYLEVSCISLPQMRQVVAEADPDRIVFGTDWPFYHHALPLAKVLIATEGQPALRRKILHDNAARLLGL
jgi:predicted TIM-barrel fold metal-dependent hydrolase